MDKCLEPCLTVLSSKQFNQPTADSFNWSQIVEIWQRLSFLIDMKFPIFKPPHYRQF
jgi:hypothetical protein